MAPAVTRSATQAALEASLWACTLTSRRPEGIPIAVSSALVRRVSSQQMTSAASSTDLARAERSPRFPIGVATTTSWPLTSST